MRVYTNKGDGDKAKYALKVAVDCLNWYQDYFKINYPLPKCDLIAIDDFTGGAMENWGLITFRSSQGSKYEKTACRMNFKTIDLFEKKIPIIFKDSHSNFIDVMVL